MNFSFSDVVQAFTNGLITIEEAKKLSGIEQALILNSSNGMKAASDNPETHLSL